MIVTMSLDSLIQILLLLAMRPGGAGSESRFLNCKWRIYKKNLTHWTARTPLPNSWE